MTSRAMRVPVLLAVLAGALLAVTTAGPMGAGEAAQAVVEPRVTVTRAITIPAAVFNPRDQNTGFWNDGSYLEVISGGAAYFLAPVFFEASEVTVKKITLFARDNGPYENICVWLMRLIPATGGREEMGSACSSGASDQVRVFTSTDFTYRLVRGAYGHYLVLYLPGFSDARFHGVRITYTYETGV